MPANVQLIYSNRANILEQISTADLVIGGVLLPAPRRRSSSARKT